jgi:hypothetical protein
MTFCAPSPGICGRSDRLAAGSCTSRSRPAMSGSGESMPLGTRVRCIVALRTLLARTATPDSRIGCGRERTMARISSPQPNKYVVRHDARKQVLFVRFRKSFPPVVFGPLQRIAAAHLRFPQVHVS